MRNRFDEQLHMLNRKMIEMGAVCETLIARAAKALTEGDTELAEQVVTDGSMIDRAEQEIEALCVKLLLQQQPVATDLRQISAALKMVTDMERIGDQAEEIAQMIPFLQGQQPQKFQKIRQMAQAAIEMVKNSIDAFVKKDVELAQSVIAQDDVVDAFFANIKDLLIGRIAEKPNEGEVALDILMIAKYFERIGDHAVNIAEWVIYSVTGERKGETT